jgi:hypothetical protein
MSVPAPKPSVSREWALDIVQTSTNDKNLDLEGPAQAVRCRVCTISNPVVISCVFHRQMVIELANLFADDVIRGAYGASIARGSTTGISKEDLEAFLGACMCLLPLACWFSPLCALSAATAWSDLVIPGDLPSRAPARPPTIQQKEVGSCVRLCTHNAVLSCLAFAAAGHCRSACCTNRSC